MKTTVIRFITVLPILISGCASVDEQHTLLRSDTSATREDMSLLLENLARPVPIGTPAEIRDGIAPGRPDSTSLELKTRDRPNIDSAPLNLE